jgi:cytochrome c oxidase subunit 2
MKPLNLILLVAVVVGIVLSSHWLGQQSYGWLAPAASLEAEEVGHLFSFLVTLASIVFLGVVGMMLYSMLVYRAARGDLDDGPAIRGNTRLEVTWTVIPILLVLWIASYSFNIYQRMSILGPLPLTHLHLLPAQAAQARELPTAEAIPSQPLDEPIEVIARQWSWTFRYPDQNVSSTELHLPVNQRVQLMLSSEDVLHGFYVPNFRIKQDIVPNRTIELKFTPSKVGTYTLHDSQFSGTYFALMQAQVIVEPPEAYGQWLARAAEKPAAITTDPATSEHTQPANPSLPMRSNWPSVSPADPPPVNHQGP